MRNYFNIKTGITITVFCFFITVGLKAQHTLAARDSAGHRVYLHAHTNSGTPPPPNTETAATPEQHPDTVWAFPHARRSEAVTKSPELLMRPDAPNKTQHKKSLQNPVKKER